MTDCLIVGCWDAVGIEFQIEGLRKSGEVVLEPHFCSELVEVDAA